MELFYAKNPKLQTEDLYDVLMWPYASAIPLKCIYGLVHGPWTIYGPGRPLNQCANRLNLLFCEGIATPKGTICDSCRHFFL